MALNIDPRLTLVFGLFGNVVSFLVFLSPLPTFYRIYKKKSTEDFQSIPYSVSLFSCMLTLYYASLKIDAYMLITINSFGILIQSIYLFIFFIYAPNPAKIFTAKLVIMFNFGTFALIILLTSKLSHGTQRMNVVGWICALFSIAVFAAPLAIMRKVIKTKSVEYMPFSLSFFLTLCAICWFGYGASIGDWYIAAPNVVGLIFGCVQMALYFMYKNGRVEILPQTHSSELPNNATHTRKDETHPPANIISN